MDTEELEVGVWDTAKYHLYRFLKTAVLKLSSVLARYSKQPDLILSFWHLSKQKAVEVMCFVPKRCNDMMNVGRLQGFEVRLELRISY